MVASTIALSLSGATVEAQLVQPPAPASAVVLLLHCLPAEPVDTLAGTFASRGWVSICLNCAGDRAVSSPAQAADAAREAISRFGLPLLLVGHSYGALLLLSAAGGIDGARALITINAPAGLGGYSRRASPGSLRYNLGSTALAVPEAAAPELAWSLLQERVEHLRRPLLILHAPMDNVVELANAAQLFTAAKHPKSFVAIDSGDHLLSRAAEARHAAEMTSAWASRYLAAAAPASRHATEVVVAEAGQGRFRQHVAAGRHRLVADEPVSMGGADAGPSPYELLLSALGACTAMTLRMYAEHKRIPLRHVSVALRHEKIHAEACRECETKEGKIDKIERVVTLQGDLDAATRERLLEIANKCPVHRTLHSEVWVPTRLAE